MQNDVLLKFSISGQNKMMHLFLALNFFFAFQLRAAAGGFMVFKQAFVSIFVMLAISGVVALLFRVVLYNVIDTSIPEQMREISIEQVEAVFETMGLTDQEAIDKALEEIDKQDFSLGIANFTKELLINLGMAAFFALIISLFVKKNPPLNYVKDEGLDDGQYDDI